MNIGRTDIGNRRMLNSASDTKALLGVNTLSDDEST